VLLVTLKVTVQLPFAGIVIPVKLSAVAPATRVFGVVPPQVPVTAPPAALMFASVSVNAPPVRADALLFANVNVTAELPPDAIVTGLNAFAIVGGASAVTVKVAVLLAAPAVGVCVEVTPEVVLGFPPTVLLVTLKITVQLLLAGIAIPLKLSAVAPAASVFGVVPTQVPPTAPPTALMFASVSVNAPPLRADALPFASVNVTTELPLDGIETGLNALEIVGALETVRVAVLLGGPAVVVCDVVTPVVVLFWTPSVLLVTLKITVQLLVFASVIAPNPRFVAPAARLFGVVPTQVPVTGPPTALMFTSVSLKFAPTRLPGLVLDSVRVTTEVPPAVIAAGLNALVMVGTA
jgi:hypothetical protein